MDCPSCDGAICRGGHYPKKLILAAADYAEDDNAQPPPELTLAWTLERWGALAMNGELPAGLLKRMTACLNVYEAFRSYSAGASRLADWSESNPQQARIVTSVMQMRKHA